MPMAMGKAKRARLVGAGDALFGSGYLIIA
jgi:hypothetical protein